VGVAGSGVTGDLIAHCIDTAMWLNGGISSVTGLTETFIKVRHHNITGKTEKVGIDDACAFMCHFNNGSLGLFESTRYARGHKALYTFEVNGENMSLKWDLHDLHRLQIFDYSDAGPERGWKSIHVSDGDHPYTGTWWVPGLQLGYEHSFIHQVVEFIAGLESGKGAKPDFKDGLATDYVVDAVLASAKTRKWAKVKQVKA
jgi:predicted dehydrogenase